MSDRHSGRIVVDGRPVGFELGDSVAIAVVRAGEVPGHGGTLCLAGDCGNCVAIVDGVAYVRTCQVPARPGLRMDRHPSRSDGLPTLPAVDGRNLVASPASREIAVERRTTDLAVIGGGTSGLAAAAAARSAGREVVVLDAAAGHDVVAIYPGPAIIVRTPTGMLHLEPHEIVVATGAAEIQPVCPGNTLAGILTATAAVRAARRRSRSRAGGRRRRRHRRASHARGLPDPWFASKATTRAA